LLVEYDTEEFDVTPDALANKMEGMGLKVTPIEPEPVEVVEVVEKQPEVERLLLLARRVHQTLNRTNSTLCFYFVFTCPFFRVFIACVLSMFFQSVICLVRVFIRTQRVREKKIKNKK